MTKRLLLAGLAAWTMPVWADCPVQSRDTTDAEKQFYVETMAAIKAALPPAPAGWKLEDRMVAGAPSSVCGAGPRKTPMPVGYEVRYLSLNSAAKQQKLSQEFDKKIQDLWKLPPDLQKESDETGRRSRDLERQARKLAATDKAESEKLMAESREVYKRVVEIREAHKKEILPKIDQVTKERLAASGGGTEVVLRVSVNGSGLHVPEGAEKTTVAGAAIALRGSKDAIIGFGPWSRQGSDVKPAYSNAGMTKPQALSLELKGDAKLVEQIMAAVNPAAFGAIVGK